MSTVSRRLTQGTGLLAFQLKICKEVFVGVWVTGTPERQEEALARSSLPRRDEREVLTWDIYHDAP